jgi:hypothetical protein
LRDDKGKEDDRIKREWGIALDAKVEFHADVDLSAHLDEFRELDGLFGRVLQVFDREDLEAGIVYLRCECYLC